MVRDISNSDAQEWDGRGIGCWDFWVVAGSYFRWFSPTNLLSRETIRKNNSVNPCKILSSIAGNQNVSHEN